MDIAALVVCDVVLAEQSFRAAARRLGRPVSSVANAVRRVEADLAVKLFRGDGGSLSITLDGRRFVDKLGNLRRLAEELAAPALGGEDRLRHVVGLPVSVATLQHFCETLDAGSIRRAALRLGLGQPHLTRQLKRLEEHLGVQLIERLASGCSATPAGARVAGLAVRLVAGWHSMIATSANDFRHESRQVRIGSIVPIGHESQVARRLAALVAGWDRLPNFRPLFLSSTTAEELITSLKLGRLDFALVDVAAATNGLAGLPIDRSRLGLVGRSGLHPRGVAPLEVLRSSRVAVPSLRSGLRGAIRAIFEAGGAGTDRTPANFVEIDSLPVIINLIREHGFVSVLPLGSTEGIAGLEVVPLGEDYDLQLWLIWQSRRDLRAMALDIARLLGCAPPPAHS